MSPQFFTVQNKGIFHSLPTFPEHDGKKYTAIVTGANGLSGSHIVDVLAEAPERWGIIYAMSRRAPVSTRSNVKNIAADFLGGTPEELAESFKKQGITAWVLSLRAWEFVKQWLMMLVTTSSLRLTSSLPQKRAKLFGQIPMLWRK
jgi:hypothetical protein